MTDIFDFIGLKNMTTSQDYLPNLNEQEWIMSMPIDEILNIQKAVSIYFFLKNVLVTSNFDSSIIACISWKFLVIALSRVLIKLVLWIQLPPKFQPIDLTMIYDLQCFYLHYIVYVFNITFGQIKCCEVEFFETFKRVIQPISYFLLHDVIDTQELRIIELK